MVTAGRFSYHGAADDDKPSPSCDKTINNNVITVDKCHVLNAMFLFKYDVCDREADSMWKWKVQKKHSEKKKLESFVKWYLIVK